MQNTISIRNQLYSIQDCGGRGHCLFNCLAQSISKENHQNTRKTIVDFVVNNWAKYEQDVQMILFKNNPRQYSAYMRNSNQYGSEVECKAASHLYKTKIILYRKFHNGAIYSLDFEIDSTAENPTLYLLFTGNRKDGDKNGHYQILNKINNQINNNSQNNRVLREIFLENDNFSNILHNNQRDNFEINVPESNNNAENNENFHENNENTENFQDNIPQDNERYASETNITFNFNALNTKKSLKNNKKRTKTKKKVFYKCCKEIILNVRKYMVANQKKFKIKNVNKTTSECLKISRSYVAKIAQQAILNKGLVHNAKFKNCGRKKIVLEEFFQAAIRRQMLIFYHKSKFPSVKELREKMKILFPDFPDVSLYTLSCALKNMNFSYKKYNKKPVLMESTSIKASRVEYLRKIKSYRLKNYKIFYLDETWCGANHTRKYGWVEQIKSSNFDSYDHFRSSVQQVFGERGGFI